MKTLVFIPTYNERDNVEKICTQIFGLNLGADVLFIDDNSPDGTGKVLDELSRQYANLFVVHRAGKLGVGSAHLDGIAWAYERGYERLITLDCDFTHSPEDILLLLKHADNFDVVLGSRFLNANSLPGWTLYRRLMTHLGHFLTRYLLRIKEDATGAFRVYRLSTIPRSLFSMVKSRGYSFFFESLFVLTRNDFSVKEVSIVLPTRTYGSSKMSVRDIHRSVTRMLSLFWRGLVHPRGFRINRRLPAINPTLVDPQDWNGYWNERKDASGVLFALVATLYRNAIIKRCLNGTIRRTFARGARLLHAGCGSGHVDEDIQKEMSITGVDISPSALQIYSANVPDADGVLHASIFCLPFPQETFDGVYNLGVMEHFSEEEIKKILQEFYRVMKPGGKLVLFWPHYRGTSVIFLKFVHWVLNRVSTKPVKLHPDEITLVKSKAQIQALLEGTGFSLVDYSFGPRDFWVQAAIVAEKRT